MSLNSGVSVETTLEKTPVGSKPDVPARLETEKLIDSLKEIEDVAIDPCDHLIEIMVF